MREKYHEAIKIISITGCKTQIMLFNENDVISMHNLTMFNKMFKQTKSKFNDFIVYQLKHT